MAAQDLITAASPNQLMASKILCLQVQIYLLAQIAGNTMTAQQLITSASQYQPIASDITAQQVIIYLLNQIQTGGGTGGGGQTGTGSPQGVVTGNPGNTYYDTATGNFWVKGTGTGTNTGWVEIVGT